ncbi:STAS domain-containing protein [Mycobacterium deserti]|uniref:STAS domain-containing protein n=1 Tax=Mycobacterium deserti TaxID=2978347 RepID=A0ABT2MJ67_9MYCO|nr:STAS domain-containing protein [Mycobacterium deserti]MCT7661140.1 STAS domain-containing protein [Mycobacterium deserti]
MPTPLNVTTRRRDDGRVVLSAVGELDLSNVDAFGRALAEATDGAMVTVDFSGVEYLDSAAINLLFAHTEHIELVVNPILLPVLKISGLADVVDVHSAPPASER